jgi:hypothetical protein
MKKFLILLSPLLMVGLAPAPDVIYPVLEDHTDTNLSKACPYYSTPSASNIGADEDSNVPTYNHCSVCQQGVLLEHEGGIIRCTYCGVREKYNKENLTSISEDLK